VSPCGGKTTARSLPRLPVECGSFGGSCGAGAARLLLFGGRLGARRRFDLPCGGAAAGVRSPFGSELLGGLAELLFDFRSGEVAGERGVRDVVVAGECPQRLAGRAAPKQVGVGCEPSQPGPVLERGRPRLRPLERVVVKGSHEDHGIDVVGDSLERGQLGDGDHGLDAAAGGDDPFGLFVVGAVQLGAGKQRQPWWLTILRPAREMTAGTAPARPPLGKRRPVAVLLFVLGRELLLGPPAYLLLEPPLDRATGRKYPLVGPKLLHGLPELRFHLRPGEIAAQRRVRNPVVAGELAQRRAGRAAANQLLVGNEPAQATATLHSTDSSP
jgi:hypothetical protein